MSEEIAISKLRLLALNCFLAELNLANIVLAWTEQYDANIPLDEILQTKELVSKVEHLICRFPQSDDKRPPDKLPVYLEGGSKCA